MRSLPKNINDTATLYLHYAVQSYPTVSKIVELLKDQGWNIYVVEGKRGYCTPHTKTITIPLWCFNATNKGCKDTEYRIQYLSHEMAHAIAGIEANHGPKFMEVLIAVCPPHLLKYELKYKPRNAKKAGIYDL